MVGEEPSGSADWTLLDVAGDGAHHTAIQQMLGMGAMTFDPSLGWGRFRPQAAATRSQLASHLMVVVDDAAYWTGSGHPSAPPSEPDPWLTSDRNLRSSR